MTGRQAVKWSGGPGATRLEGRMAQISGYKKAPQTGPSPKFFFLFFSFFSFFSLRANNYSTATFAHHQRTPCLPLKTPTTTLLRPLLLFCLLLSFCYFLSYTAIIIVAVACYCYSVTLLLWFVTILQLRASKLCYQNGSEPSSHKGFG